MERKRDDASAGGFFFLLALLPDPADASFQSKEDVNRWISTYYHSPDPAGLTLAMEFMNSSGLLDDRDVIAPVTGFLAGVFHDTSGQVGGWIKELG